MTVAGLRPTGLKCEYRTDPLGIGETSPRLSWALEAEGGTSGSRPTASWSPANEADLEAERT